MRKQVLLPQNPNLWLSVEAVERASANNTSQMTTQDPKLLGEGWAVERTCLM